MVMDVQALQVEGYADRGIGRYVSAFAAAMHRRRAVLAALLAPELPPALALPGGLAADGLVRWDSAETCRDLIWPEGRFREAVYLVTAPFLHVGPADPPALGPAEHWARTGLRRAVVLYDLIPLRAPRHYLPSPAHRARYQERAEWVASADLVFAISEHTRREAIDLLGCPPGSVHAVGAGVSPYFSPTDGSDEELWRHHFPGLVGRPFVMTVGGSDVRKGTERAVAAAAQLASRGLDVHLLVAGHLTVEWSNRLRDTARACGVADRVVFAGAVTDELLRAGYRRALLTLMPSLAEGVGLPVLESAACGAPALASAGTALGDTAAVPEAWFDPADVDSIADAVARVIESPSLGRYILAAQQQACRAASWDAVAARTEDAIRPGPSEAGGPAVAEPARRVLVVVSGTARVLGAALAEAVQGQSGWDRAEVVMAGPGPLDGAAIASSAFGTDLRPVAFDHVVYLGGDADDDVWEVATRHPGWIWLREMPAPARLQELRRRSRGFIAATPQILARLQLEMGRLGAGPPLAHVRPVPGEVGLLVDVLAGRATAGPAAGPAGPGAAG